MKKVSLYIPSFNADRYIESCIKAVLKQTYPIEEILVIDDGSADKTREIASRFPVKIVCHSFNKGLATARNTAIKAATCDFIASLDADCVPDKNWLKILIGHFTSSKIGGIGGKTTELPANNIVNSWRAAHMKQEWGEKKTGRIPFLFGSNNVFRKKCLIDIGGYDDKYVSNYEDVDICKRAKKAGYKLLYVPQASVSHIKKDDILSLFSAFWNWNFVYHAKKGYYRNTQKLSLKMRENIGLANRFMLEDFSQKRLKLLYVNFLMSMCFFFKDFIFVHNKADSALKAEDIPFSVLYFSLIDLTFFYHLDLRDSLSRTLLAKQAGFIQNFPAFFLLTGSVLKEKSVDPVFVKMTFEILLKKLLKKENNSPAFLSERLISMISACDDWSGFLAKKHPNLNRKLLKIFIVDFNNWLDGLNAAIPDFFNLMVISQKKLLTEEGMLCNAHS